MSTAALAGPSERRLGRYTLLGEIASGGMATVHVGRLAAEGGFSRVVAIKVLHRHLADDPDFRAMFLDEARLAARIQHPNVVSTIDVGTSDEGMFLVTEYVTGESVAGLVRSSTELGEPMSLPIAIRILIDTLHGLHAAHVATDDNGSPLSIVHRDVSPQNILVGTDGRARVIDFGIAKAAGSSHMTRGGQLRGKPRYMAPEQIKDTELSAQTDIYAASVVLWELLTGERLFAGSSDGAVLGRVLEGVIAPPSKLAPGISPELDAIVQRGLAREAQDRFASAQEMAEALEAMSPATSRQVGTWIERVASEALGQRAARIAGSLASPERPGPVTSAGEPLTKTSPAQGVANDSAGETLLHPFTAPARPPAPVLERTQVLRVSAKGRKPDAPPQRGRAVVVGALILGGFAMAGMGAVLVSRRAPRDESAAARPSAADPQAASASAGAATGPPTEAASGAPSSGAPLEPPRAPAANASAPDEQPSAARAGPALRGTHGPPSRPRGRAPGNNAGVSPNPAAACNPPYYEDPSGIRRVKPQCL